MLAHSLGSGAAKEIISALQTDEHLGPGAKVCGVGYGCPPGRAGLATKGFLPVVHNDDPIAKAQIDVQAVLADAGGKVLWGRWEGGAGKRVCCWRWVEGGVGPPLVQDFFHFGDHAGASYRRGLEAADDGEPSQQHVLGHGA